MGLTAFPCSGVGQSQPCSPQDGSATPHYAGMGAFHICHGSLHFSSLSSREVSWFTGKSLKKGIGGIALLFEWSQGHVPLERKLGLSVTSVEQTSLHAWGAKPRLRETRRVAADGRSLKPALSTTRVFMG